MLGWFMVGGYKKVDVVNFDASSEHGRGGMGVKMTESNRK
jgi:hypothetical protein